jgi:hypothetical protein
MLGDADSLIYLILPWQQILLVVTTVIESIIFVMDCHIGHVCDGVHNWGIYIAVVELAPL